MERKELIKQMLLDWQETLAKRSYFARELKIPALNSRYITTLIGPRRAGKTSLLQRMAREWTTKNPSSPALYVNFEDERLDLSVEELSLILDCYRELYPNAGEQKPAFFFDEIQAVPNWEKFIRRCHEAEEAVIAITGSNSKALSSDIATSLRGRTVSSQVLPLSFREFWSIKTKHSKPDTLSSKGKALVLNALREYLKYGGFPAVVLEPEVTVKQQMLQEYFQVLLLKDLIERYKVQQVSALKFFLKRLLASASRPLSVHKIYSELKSAGYAISKDTIYDFMDYAESIYFVRRISQYSKKTVEKELGEKKIYPIDNGYLFSILGVVDLTKSLENALFFDFYSRGFELSYFRGENECDFILHDANQKLSAYQCAFSLNDPETEKRELRGLAEACRVLNIKYGSIITAEDSGSKTLDKQKVPVVPFYRFAHQEY